MLAAGDRTAGLVAETRGPGWCALPRMPPPIVAGLLLVLLVLVLVAGLPDAVRETPGRDSGTPGYIRYSCLAVLYANWRAVMWRSQRRWFLSTYCAIIVFMVLLARSTGLQCGAYAGVAFGLIPYEASVWFMAFATGIAVRCSDIIVSGHPCRRITCFTRRCMNAGVVARRRGLSSTHLVNRSCITSSHACPVERGKGPIKSMDTCSYGVLIGVAWSRPAGRSWEVLCARQFAHSRKYFATSANMRGQ